MDVCKSILIVSIGIGSADYLCHNKFTEVRMSAYVTNDDQTGTVSRDTMPCSDFIRGYIDCAKESFRFLTEEEGMSVDHPVIKDLQAGLLKHIQILQIPLILREIIALGFEEEADTDSESCDECEESGSNHHTANLVPEQLLESDDCLPSPHEIDNETVVASIAEEIFKIVFHHDIENEESEISDVEMSTDDGLHEN